VTIIGVIMTNL